MIVVDASIIVKTVLDEPDSDQVATFLRRMQGELHGPDILTFEVCRAWTAAANARRIDKALARAAIDQWLRGAAGGGMAVHPVDRGLMLAAFDLAAGFGHPLADCIYLALADRLGCPVVTADVKFRDRVANPARVRLLADFP